MSWIFGFLGKHDHSAGSIAKMRAIHRPPLFTIEREVFYLAMGGIAQVCQHGTFGEMQKSEFSGWAVAGLGFEKNSENRKALAAADWQNLLSPPHPALSQLDGHFVALKWKPGHLQCYTDCLGLRTLFLLEIDSGCAFSTRLDWLAQMNSGCQIDFGIFGAQWLLFNQLTYDSFVHGIKRVGPAGVATCTPSSIQMTHKPYTPDFSGAARRSLHSVLQPLLDLESSDSEQLSLGLSGGLDSRALLTLLAANRQRPFALHVFGHAEHPDVGIARQIAAEEGFALRHFDDPLPDAEKSWDLLQDYAAQACVVEPASAILHTRYYPKLFAGKKFVVDGGFGEIARRQFFNRILKRGRQALTSGNPASIFPFLHVFRADIFQKEILQIMKKGALQQIESTWSAMPAIDEIGRENFLDLLAIRTRLPNYYGFEQSRLDGDVVNYMPFAQPSFLQYVFEAPVHMRRNGTLYRQLIRQNLPSLAKYPLVKGTTTYPFYLGTVPAWLWTKLKSRLGRQFADPALPAFLGGLSGLLADLAHSADVKSYPAYDHQSIVKMVDGFLAGKSEYAQQINWWLSLEAWRRSIRATSV